MAQEVRGLRIDVTMKNKEEILKRCLKIAIDMDRNSPGVAGMYVGELSSLLWVIGLDYDKVFNGRPIPKFGKRNTFRQDKIKELFENESVCIDCKGRNGCKSMVKDKKEYCKFKT